MTRVALGILVGLALGAVLFTLQARPHNLPGTKHNRVHAITFAFCGSERRCAIGDEARRVFECESGPNLWPYARNGEYWGLAQFGGWARSRYGFSWSPWEQARAAYRYWLVAGWSPWECA